MHDNPLPVTIQPVTMHADLRTPFVHILVNKSASKICSDTLIVIQLSKLLEFLMFSTFVILSRQYLVL